MKLPLYHQSREVKMIQIQIISEPLPVIKSVDSHTHDGSEIIFHGRVRDNENNNKIKGYE